MLTLTERPTTNMKRISPAELFQLSESLPILDVRAPQEYLAGHLPGAQSLPLFDDDERAEIGTIYKNIHADEAKLVGLEYAGKKMRQLVEQARKLAPDGKAVIHCWRGGQRSAAMGWLLDFADLDICILEGGYKGYRRYIREQICHPKYQFLVLGGPTGSGKTDLLEALNHLGEQVVDLEGLANHKGSAFGWIDEAPQPSSEQFENDLFEAMRHLDPAKPIWIENESRGIGTVFMPVEFAEKLRNSPLIQIGVSHQSRIERLVRMYVHCKKELAASFEKIQRKLGGQHYQAALEALDRDDFQRAAEIALVYYDRTYQHSLERSSPPTVVRQEFGDLTVNEIARQLRELAPTISVSVK